MQNLIKDKAITSMPTNDQPLSKINGTNYRNTVLNIEDNMAMVSKTWRSKAPLFLFGLGCSLFFIFIAFMSVISAPNLQVLWGTGLAVYVVLFSLFALMMLFLYRVTMRVHCFDLTKRLYYLGKENSKKAICLSALASIQVIKKKIYFGSDSFYSYELNLVMTSGKRTNLMDHSEGDYVKLSAKRLADFLALDLAIID